MVDEDFVFIKIFVHEDWGICLWFEGYAGLKKVFDLCWKGEKKGAHTPKRLVNVIGGVPWNHYKG